MIVSDVARSLGITIAFVEAGVLVAQAATGNFDITLVAAFVGSGLMGAALPAATPAIAVLALTAAAGWLSREGMQIVMDNLEESRNELNRFMIQNPDMNLTEGFLQMLFEALGGVGPNTYSYNPPHGTGDPNLWIP